MAYNTGHTQYRLEVQTIEKRKKTLLTLRAKTVDKADHHMQL